MEHETGEGGDVDGLDLTLSSNTNVEYYSFQQRLKMVPIMGRSQQMTVNAQKQILMPAATLNV